MLQRYEDICNGYTPSPSLSSNLFQLLLQISRSRYRRFSLVALKYVKNSVALHICFSRWSRQSMYCMHQHCGAAGWRPADNRSMPPPPPLDGDHETFSQIYPKENWHTVIPSSYPHKTFQHIFYFSRWLG